MSLGQALRGTVELGQSSRSHPHRKIEALQSLEQIPSGRVDRCRVFQWLPGLPFNLRKSELGSGFVAFSLIASLTGKCEIRYSITAPARLWNDVLNLERDICLEAVGASPAPLFKQILSNFISGQLALLILNPADLRVLHQLSVEFDQLHRNTGDWIGASEPFHPRLNIAHTTFERRREPSFWTHPIEKADLPISRFS